MRTALVRTTCLLLLALLLASTLVACREIDDRIREMVISK